MPQRDPSETSVPSPDPDRDRALAEIRDRISARIRPLLGRMPEDKLAALIDRMAKIDLAYRTGSSNSPRNSK